MTNCLPKIKGNKLCYFILLNMSYLVLRFSLELKLKELGLYNNSRLASIKLQDICDIFSKSLYFKFPLKRMVDLIFIFLLTNITTYPTLRSIRHVVNISGTDNSRLLICALAHSSIVSRSMWKVSVWCELLEYFFECCPNSKWINW